MIRRNDETDLLQQLRDAYDAEKKRQNERTEELWDDRTPENQAAWDDGAAICYRLAKQLAELNPDLRDNAILLECFPLMYPDEAARIDRELAEGAAGA